MKIIMIIFGHKTDKRQTNLPFDSRPVTLVKPWRLKPLRPALFWAVKYSRPQKFLPYKLPIFILYLVVRLLFKYTIFFAYEQVF